MSTTLIIIKGFFERKKNVGIKTWTGGGGDVNVILIR
jgi:hypothetical protein